MTELLMDNLIWVGLLGGTAALYLLNYILNRSSKQTVYRISNDSLAKSKQVMLRVLKLVEDEQNTPLDERLLPFEKEQIKSAGKILGYFYLSKRLSEDYRRVKDGYIALSRFQDLKLPENKQLDLMKKEAIHLRYEFEAYIRRSPMCESPENGDAQACASVNAESEPRDK